MTKILHSVGEKEFFLLLENSIKSIPFNIFLATLLMVGLFFHKVPILAVSSWYLIILIISSVRWFFSKKILKNDLYGTQVNLYLKQFIFLTFLMGACWGVSYFIFKPYIPIVQEFIILLVLGGMSAGALASLSVFMPAYYAYILPMFVPIIVYNYYLMQTDRIILASMFLLFVVMLIVTARVNENLLQRTFKLTDEKDFLIKKLKKTNKKLEQSNKEIKLISITDSLTGLYNRRHFNTIFYNEINRAKRSNQSVSLLLIDIDNFKFINDTFGHPYGDSFLKNIANTLKHSLQRSSDFLFRLGGDEFAAVLANLSLEETNQVCAAIRNKFKTTIKHDEVTLSMGVVYIYANFSSDMNNIFQTADKILYEAKKNGKNQTICKEVMQKA